MVNNNLVIDIAVDMQVMVVIIILLLEGIMMDEDEVSPITVGVVEDKLSFVNCMKPRIF